MSLNKCMLLPTIVMLLCWGGIAQQAENKDAAGEAAELAKIERITVDDLKSKIANNATVLILDVRMPKDYDRAEKKIKGSVRMSPLDLESRMNELPRDKDIVTYCT